MNRSLPSLFLAIVLVCGCGGGIAPSSSEVTDDGTTDFTVETSTASDLDQPAGSGQPAESTPPADAIPARRLILDWVGNVGALAEDPYRRQRFTLTGEVIRVTPKRWNYVDNYDTVVASVSLHGDAAAWGWIDETWITCVFEDAADVEQLKSGQTVTIDGRYGGSPFNDKFLDDCRLVAAGEVPADGQEPPPLPSLSEWKSIVARKDAFYQANTLPLEINEKRGLLWLELEDDLFELSEEELSAAFDAVEGFPIGWIECAGEGASQLLKELPRFPGLRVLMLKGDLNCTAEELSQLRDLQYLDTLAISNCDSINDEFAAAIGQISSLKFLTLQKGFRGYGLTDAGVAALAQLPKLRALKLTMNNDITDESLAQIAKLPELRSLSCEYSSPYELTGGFSDAGLAALAPESLPKLVLLDLEGQNRVTDAGIESLIEQGRHFAFLNLGSTGVTDAGFQRLVDGKLTDRLYVWRDYGLPKDASEEVRQKLVDAGLIQPPRE